MQLRLSSCHTWKNLSKPMKFLFPFQVELFIHCKIKSFFNLPIFLYSPWWTSSSVSKDLTSTFPPQLIPSLFKEVSSYYEKYSSPSLGEGLAKNFWSSGVHCKHTHHIFICFSVVYIRIYHHFLFYSHEYFKYF